MKPTPVPQLILAKRLKNNMVVMLKEREGSRLMTIEKNTENWLFFYEGEHIIHSSPKLHVPQRQFSEIIKFKQDKVTCKGTVIKVSWSDKDKCFVYEVRYKAGEPHVSVKETELLSPTSK